VRRAKGVQVSKEKKIYTVKAKVIVHVVRTYKKFAESIDEARELVALNPSSHLEEERVYSELNSDSKIEVWSES
jgi:hypothetical protein